MSAIAFPLLLFLFFGTHHLGQFHTADEDLWFASPTTGRVHSYWDAMRSGRWEATRINDKPGVTTALLSGSIGLLVDTEPERKVVETGDQYLVSDPEVSERTAFFFRLPILISNATLILVLFFLTRKYIGNGKTAAIFALFLFLSPILLGISQIVNPDSTLWSFSFVAVLSFLVFLKHGGNGYLALSAAASGFALLDKYTAVFQLIFLLFLTISHVMFFGADADAVRTRIRRATAALLLVLSGAAVIFLVFMPAAIIDPSLLYTGTFGFEHSRNIPLLISLVSLFSALLLIDTVLLKNVFLRSVSRVGKKSLPFLFLAMSILVFGLHLFAVVNWTLDNPFGLPSTVAFDQAQGAQFRNLTFIKKIAFEARPIVFTLTPVVLVFFLFEVAVSALRFRRNRSSFLRFSLLSYIVLFYAAVLFQDLLIDARYGIMLYPAIFLMAAFGAESFRNLVLKRLLSENHLRHASIALSVGIAFSSLLSLRSAVPFYFNYTNSLLPLKNSVTTAWGYGGYEAAQYINALPDAEQLTVWADYEGFCKFFVGKCIRGSDIKRYDDGNFGSVDYFIVTRRGSQLQKKTWSAIKKTGIIHPDPVWNLSILDRPSNFVSIYEQGIGGSPIDDTGINGETEDEASERTPDEDQE